MGALAGTGFAQKDWGIVAAQYVDLWSNLVLTATGPRNV